MNTKQIKKILLKTILPHLCIVLSGMLIVLLAIDRVNNAMMFIDHRITKGLMWVLCIASIVNGAQLLLRPAKKSAAKAKKSAPPSAQ